MSKYSYEIKPRPPELGDGWKLTLLEDGEEVGGGIFPVAAEDPYQGMEWWNALEEKSRSYWLMMAASAVPADARHAYLLSEAYHDAMQEAEDWIGTR
jgi:hypothetical protein